MSAKDRYLPRYDCNLLLKWVKAGVIVHSYVTITLISKDRPTLLAGDCITGLHEYRFEAEHRHWRGKISCACLLDCVRDLRYNQRNSLKGFKPRPGF